MSNVRATFSLRPSQRTHSYSMHVLVVLLGVAVIGALGADALLGR